MRNTAEAIYRLGLTTAIEAIENIEDWNTPEDAALTDSLLRTLRDCLIQGDELS